MRFFSADLIFPIHTAPLENGIVVVGPEGRIIDLLAADDDRAPEKSRIEHFKGALCPGFVNAHCHLELSHMKGLVAQGTGLPAFVMQIISRRDQRQDLKFEAIRLADEEMWRNGIEAVGDICNTADTLEVKKNSRIRYHSFVEVFSFDPAKAERVLEKGIATAEQFSADGLRATIVPHAPYSVSRPLFNGIRAWQQRFPGPVSMHNQETESEDEMFRSASGPLMDTFRKFGEDFSHFPAGYDSSLDYALDLLPSYGNIILVHNTFTSVVDLERALGSGRSIYWCTCPNANQYIEERTADLPMWLAQEATVCVGTDSLASNHQLSVLDELRTIRSVYPTLTVEQLLRSATLNGARALGMDAELGSLQKGKRPGLVWLKQFDMKDGGITAYTQVQRII